MATFKSNKGEFTDDQIRKYVQDNFNADTYKYLVNQKLIRPSDDPEELKQRATYYGLTQLLGMPDSEARAAMASVFEKGSKADLDELARLYERSMIIGVPTSALQEAAAKVGLTSTDSYDIQRFLADRGITSSAVTKGTPSYESIVELGPQINAKDNPIQGGNLIFQPGYDAPGSNTNIYDLAKSITAETDATKRAELEKTAQAEQAKMNTAAKAEAEAEAAANIEKAKQAVQPKGAVFDTSVKTVRDDGREGTGVSVGGESGLREGYAPYVQRLLERASAEADVPFLKYTGTSPLLESAKAGIANLTTPAQFLQGTNLAQAAGIGALEYGQYKPTAFTTGTFANPVQTETTVPKAHGGEIEGYDAGGTVDVGGNPATNPYTVPANPNIQPVNYGGQNVTNVQASYMSPYMQNVVDVQQREAKRQADIANQAIGAKAAQAGAFGGARHGLLESEANRNLMTQLGGIQAKGLQDAYTQGLGQFNVEQGRGLEAQKMSEQSRQFGAELGLKGLQTGIQAGQALGNLGQQQGYLDLATLKQMADLGTADRNFDYNEFLRAEKYPYENLTFMKNMLTGLPISAAATGIDPMSQAFTGGISTIALIDMINKINTGSTGTTTTSDRRLKTDIQTIGVLDDGLKVYSYRYKSGGPMQIGVMADEVAVLRPQAYIKGGAGDGFDAVDYSKL